MNIAIITFSDFNTNYGSILQSFALKFFLQQHGHNVTFLRYREFNKQPKRTFISCIRSYVVKAYYYMHKKQIQRRKNSFSSFIQNYIPHTKLYTSEKDLETNLPNVFDAFICGSDQIWNIPVLGGLREPYFLKFVPVGKLKIAYAPSMGEYEPIEEEKNRIKDLLKSFTFISTREHESAKILSTILGVQVPTLIDPTLLLNDKQWLSAIGKKNTPKGDYGVCYFVRRNKCAYKLVSKLKKIYNIPIYNVSDNMIQVQGTKDDYITCGPDMFINLIEGAKFCVGTSFHLAAFSTIFKKQCFIAGSQHNKNRIMSIFKLTKMENHFILDSSIIDNDFILKTENNIVDYSGINSVVTKSKEFLLNALVNG